MTKAWSIFLALIGIFLHSVGILLQKKGSNNLDLKQFKDLRHFKLTSGLITWVSGLILAYWISVIPTAMASSVLSPEVVSAISGLGIVIIIVLSHIFLKEELYRSDIVYSIVIVACIFILSITQKKEPITTIDKAGLYIMTLWPLLLLIPIFFKKTPGKSKAVLFSAISGLTGGVAYVMLNVAMKNGGNSLNGIFGSAYIYEYFVIGFVSGAFLQIAYRFGDIIHIVPIQMSLTVVYPLVCSFFIFHSSLSLIEDVSILVIAACCWLILLRH